MRNIEREIGDGIFRGFKNVRFYRINESSIGFNIYEMLRDGVNDEVNTKVGRVFSRVIYQQFRDIYYEKL